MLVRFKSDTKEDFIKIMLSQPRFSDTVLQIVLINLNCKSTIQSTRCFIKQQQKKHIQEFVGCVLFF